MNKELKQKKADKEGVFNVILLFLLLTAASVAGALSAAL
tara:strand:- start:1024 stop:1140 length:117 start_codon:yes stop_codon:yes gene_type:complete